MTRLTLTAPLIIGPRLLPAVRLGDSETGGFVSLDLAEGVVYIDPFGGFPAVTTSAPTLGAWYSAVGRESEAVRETMTATLDFLHAFAEAHHPTWGGPDSEQWDLFPVEVGEWAYLNDDEIAITASELRGEDE